MIAQTETTKQRDTITINGKPLPVRAIHEPSLPHQVLAVMIAAGVPADERARVFRAMQRKAKRAEVAQRA